MIKSLKGITIGQEFQNVYGTTVRVQEIIHNRLNQGGVIVTSNQCFTFAIDPRKLRKGIFVTPHCPTVLNLGFLGVGTHTPSLSNGEINPTYNRWKALLGRCYDSNVYHRNNAYKFVEVDQQWFNFQNFAEWITNQPGFDLGWQIDKDLFGNGRLYSPKHCCLLPGKINCALINHDKFEDELPVGVNWHKKNQKYVVLVGSKYHGSFVDMKEAVFIAHFHKTEHLRKLILKYKSVLPENIINQLNLYLTLRVYTDTILTPVNLLECKGD